MNTNRYMSFNNSRDHPNYIKSTHPFSRGRSLLTLVNLDIFMENPIKRYIVIENQSFEKGNSKHKLQSKNIYSF